MKKQPLIIALTIILVAGFYGYKNWAKNTAPETVQNKEIYAESQNPQKEEIGGKVQNTEANTESLDNTAQTINYITSNIADISPIKPVLGGKWNVIRVWIIKNAEETNDIQAYIDYEDGHITRRVLATIFIESSEITHKVEAVFKPGEDDWALIQGNDTAFGKSLLLYKKDNSTGKWQKK